MLFLPGLGLLAGSTGFAGGGSIPAGLSAGLAIRVAVSPVEVGVGDGVPVAVGVGDAVAVGVGVTDGVGVGVRLGVGFDAGWEPEPRRFGLGVQVADADGDGCRIPLTAPEVLDGPGNWLTAPELAEPPWGCVPTLLSGRFSAPELEMAPGSWLSANPPATAMTMAEATAAGRSQP